jgi:hypothetical protein
LVKDLLKASINVGTQPQPQSDMSLERIIPAMMDSGKSDTIKMKKFTKKIKKQLKIMKKGMLYNNHIIIECKLIHLFY